MSKGTLLLAALGAALAVNASAQQMPQPGPEHALLKQDVGVWDATVESWMTPGQPASVSKGVSTLSMLGEFWQVDDFKSEFMQQPFRGMGTLGYDPAKKKYVGTWADSMAPNLMVSEFDYDAKTRTMSGSIDAPGPDGKPMHMKEVTVWKDADTKVFTMSSVGADGKETLAMRITYKRRK